MANHARGDNDDLRRAAARSSAMLNARNDARRSSRAGGADPAAFEGRGTDYPGYRDGRRPRGERPGGQQPSGQRPGGQRESMLEFLKRNSVHILSVTGVVLIVLLMILFIRGCDSQGGATSGSNGGGGGDESASASLYDWSNLDRTDNRYTFSVDGKVRSRLGIDVSENQHAIDWDAVKADGIEFAIIRLGYRGATEGNLYLDEYYWDNISGAKAAGVDCGVYFFSQARTVDEAIEEAEFVLQCLDGIELEYPVAFDSEDITLGDQGSRLSDLSTDEMTAIAVAFCKRIEEGGYETMVYGNIHDLVRYNYEPMTDYRLWWAEYDSDQPGAHSPITLWQYSNGGQVAGIETAVDMNIDLSKILDKGLFN